MPQLDRMALAEYLTENSDYRKATIAVDKVYDGLMDGSYQLVLADRDIETTLRKLHQRITELNNAVARANNNNKKLIKEIDKLRLDISAHRNNLIEFLLMLRGRVNHFNGIFERTCSEYGLIIKTNEGDKSVLRWDHLRPDPNAVLGSLKYVQDFSTELQETKRKYYEMLRTISVDLTALGMKNIPKSTCERLDFQELRYNVDIILGAVDINGLRDMARSICRFFKIATELAEIFPDPNVKVELDLKYAESELTEFGIAFDKKDKFVYPLLSDVVPLATSSAEDTSNIITHVSEISLGFETLNALVRVLKQMKLCLPSARSFMVELSRHENVKGTDYSEKYYKMAANIPADLDHIANYMTTAGTFKNITKGLELGIKS